jgi:hypothetical protein
MNIYKLRHEVNDIPNTECGIYWIKIRFPSAYSVGIDTDVNQDQINKLIENIYLYSNVINNINISSRVFNKNNLMLSSIFKFSFNSCEYSPQVNKIRNIIENKSASQLLSIIKIIQNAINELPPIYVGITEKQSFKERFDQHFNGHTALKKGIENIGIGWDCINFVTFPQNDYDIDFHRDIEKVVHYILKPILSKG